jgi:hypothetical protein
LEAQYEDGYLVLELRDSENVKDTLCARGLSIGKHTVFVRGKDQRCAWGAISAVFLVLKLFARRWLKYA